MSFENKVVLVTGSGSGMGEATAILFAKERADVVIVDCNGDTANKTGEICKQYGKRVLVIKADISKSEEAKQAIEKTIEEFGRLDVLVNNAGIVREGKILPRTIMDTFDEVINTNLRSVVMMTDLAIPHLINTKGCVVNTSSIVSLAAHKGCEYPAYTIAKAGVDQYTRLAARELAPVGVRVNCVNPGAVLTNILANAGLNNADMNGYAEASALKKFSDASEVAELIMYLASDKARSITGSTYVIDNGLSLV